MRWRASPDSFLPEGRDPAPGHGDHPSHHEDQPHREEAAAVDLELGVGRQGEAGTVRHDGGEEGLEGEGEERVSLDDFTEIQPACQACSHRANMTISPNITHTTSHHTTNTHTWTHM